MIPLAALLAICSFPIDIVVADDKTLLLELKSPQMSVRMNAARTIGQHRLVSAVAPLMQAIVDEPRHSIPELDGIATPPVGACGNDVYYVQRRKVADRILAVQSSMIDALVSIGPPAYDGLLELLSKQPDVGLREKLIQVQTTVGDQRAIPILIRMAQSGVDPAINALVTLKASQALQPIYVLFRKTSDPTRKVMLAQALDRLGSERTTDELLRALVRSPASAQAITVIGHELLKRDRQRLASAVKRFLSHPNRFVRLSSISVLGFSSDSTLIPMIGSHVDSKDSVVRKAALESIAQLGRGEVEKYLRPHLQSKYPDVRDVTLSLIWNGTQNDTLRRELAERMSKDSDESVRNTVTRLKRGWMPLFSPTVGGHP